MPVSADKPNPVENRILAALPRGEQERLRAQLEPVTFTRSQVLYEREGPLKISFSFLSFVRQRTDLPPAVVKLSLCLWGLTHYSLYAGRKNKTKNLDLLLQKGQSQWTKYSRPRNSKFCWWKIIRETFAY